MQAEKFRATDRRVTMADGRVQPLSELWRERPLVLVFLRHLG